MYMIAVQGWGGGGGGETVYVLDTKGEGEYLLEIQVFGLRYKSLINIKS